MEVPELDLLLSLSEGIKIHMQLSLDEDSKLHLLLGLVSLHPIV